MWTRTLTSEWPSENDMFPGEVSHKAYQGNHTPLTTRGRNGFREKRQTKSNVQNAHLILKSAVLQWIHSILVKTANKLPFLYCNPYGTALHWMVNTVHCSACIFMVQCEITPNSEIQNVLLWTGYWEKAALFDGHLSTNCIQEHILSAVQKTGYANERTSKGGVKWI